MNTIVFGSNHNNTLGLVWSLGEAGHNVYLILLDSRINYVDKTRYVKNCVYVDSYEFVRIVESVKQIVSGLREMISLKPLKWFLMRILLGMPEIFLNIKDNYIGLHKKAISLMGMH